MEEEELMIKELKWGGEKWKVEMVYIRERLGRILGRLKGEVEEKKEEKGWILGGDFNASMGKEGALEDGEEGKRRVSKDKGINGQGTELVEWVEREGWGIMNEAKEGDK